MTTAYRTTVTMAGTVQYVHRRSPPASGTKHTISHRHFDKSRGHTDGVPLHCPFAQWSVRVTCISCASFSYSAASKLHTSFMLTAMREFRCGVIRYTGDGGHGGFCNRCGKYYPQLVELVNRVSTIVLDFVASTTCDGPR